MKFNVIEDESAAAVGNALIKVMSLFFIGIMIIAFTANPISVGTN